jgi:hypothetical protein
MTTNLDGRLLDTNVCITYMNACAKTEQKRTFRQQQLFEKFESIKGDVTDMNNLDFLQSISIERENWITD